MTKAKRICLAIPTLDMMHSDTAMCLLAMTRYNASIGLDVLHANTRSSLVAMSRNILVRIAREQQATHIFFVDSDMVFQPPTLHALIQSDRQIVGAAYSEKRPPYKITAFGKDMNRLEQYMLQGETVFEVGAMGLGCCLIDMDVFKAFDEDGKKHRPALPYFDTGTTPNGEIWGEDMIFFQRARSLGFGVWLHPVLSRSIGHLSTQPVGIATDPNAAPIVKGNA